MVGKVGLKMEFALKFWGSLADWDYLNIKPCPYNLESREWLWFVILLSNLSSSLHNIKLNIELRLSWCEILYVADDGYKIEQFSQ